MSDSGSGIARPSARATSSPWSMMTCALAIASVVVLPSAMAPTLVRYLDQPGAVVLTPRQLWRAFTSASAAQTLLRNGQQACEFREFDVHVMAVTIRSAIDALSTLFIAHPHLDADLYAWESTTLFDRATRKD